jgi:DNA-binding response OmpR family regulator
MIMNILLVDDDQQLTTLLKMQFEGRGHHIDVAYNGYDGSCLALKNSYDVIILDLMLPGMNGRKVCTKLREKQVGTPILMISSLDSQEEKHSGIMAGANDYMVKPLPFEALHEKILMLDRMRKDASG